MSVNMFTNISVKIPVFSGYDAAHEKMVVLATGLDSYTSPVQMKETLDSLGNHRTASPKKVSPKNLFPFPNFFELNKCIY